MNAPRDALILTVNAGSSSLKIGLFTGRRGEAEPALLARGKLDGIGVQPRLRLTRADGSNIHDSAFDAQQVGDMPAAFRQLYQALGEYLGDRRPTLIGHRVVHGGADFSAPLRIDAAVLARLRELEPLAPLHQPHNLAAIQVVLDSQPELPQVACFDTAFHAGRSLLSQLFGLPYALYEQGIRRYGFHGLSFEYISQYLQQRHPELAAGKLVIAHLGNGSSLCAVDGGRSVEVTTSFSALDGLPMGSRCGALDPGVLLHLLARGEDARSLEHMLYHQSGLLGISGVGSDMRSLRASSAPRARLAIDYYAYRIAQEIGRLAVSLGGLDTLVFTAGIGEKDAELRHQVVTHLAPLFGLRLDAAANGRHAERISSRDSARPILVVATDEESMIARHAWRLYQESVP
ncbi:acetate/propionate family kinase [Phytopseudomonas dryadis]|uniref:Acetate kinase n=1 Tax=Phytopseudomonas dryadis TaxID=2487520 RepID=A0A4Q9R6B3_9GAMM|nr:acetate/propionate family kinase [Pseudomonas dryadis]TBU95385.1 acetate/propionate family kinase [Pseudomonas dryadis]